MASLEELVNAALAQGAQMNPQTLADQIYAGQEQDVNRQAGNAAQQVNENTFGRGLGLSSISGYLQGQNELARATALAKARQDAMLASTQAQQSALGQAAGQVTNNLNRQAQEANLKRQLAQQRSLAGQQMLASGLGGLVNTAAGVGGLVFGQDIRRGLRGLAGAGGPTSPQGGRETMLPQNQAPGAAPALPASATGGGFSLPDLTGLDTIPSSFAPSFDISTPSFDYTTVGPEPSFDLGFSPSFDTSWLDYADWTPTFDTSGANLNDLLGYYPGY